MENAPPFTPEDPDIARQREILRRHNVELGEKPGLVDADTRDRRPIERSTKSGDALADMFGKRKAAEMRAVARGKARGDPTN